VGFVFIGAMAPSLPSLLIGAASIGATGTGVKVCADTLVQRHVPDDHLGRVFSVFDMVVNVCLVLGITVTAFLSPASGQAPVLILSVGVLYVGTAVWYRWAARPRLSAHEA